MDYLKDMHELCELLSEELAEANEKIQKAGGKISAGDLELIDKLAHAQKSLKTTMAMMEAGDSFDGNYSGRYMGGSMNGNYNSYGRNSYARGRDSRGRYVSRDGIADQLRSLMDQADDRTRTELQRVIDRMER